MPSDLDRLLELCTAATDIDIVSAGLPEREALSQFQDMFGPATVRSLLEWVGKAHRQLTLSGRIGDGEIAEMGAAILARIGSSPQLQDRPDTSEGPDGPCEGCDSREGYTCIVCDEEWCTECWEGAAHAEECPVDERKKRVL